MSQGPEGLVAPASLIRTLERIKNDWLEQPQADLDGRVPAILIDNERRRLPEAMSAKEMIIDENCDWCRMSALDVEMGFGPGFWHLDGCNMDEGFAFSTSLTLEEWETKEREREEFNRRFDREMEERRQRIARGEVVDDVYIAEEGETLDEASPSDLPF
ncbi:MAG: hypothetical protein M3539_00435 [Acidobacteriota bacterium]|nr:hypothetical protein [Acidobacteriota bacterium]